MLPQVDVEDLVLSLAVGHRFQETPDRAVRYGAALCQRPEAGCTGVPGELLDLRGERYVVPGYALPDLVAGDARPVERDFDRPGRERHRFQHMSHPFFAELVAEFASRLVVADGADRAAAQPELRHVVGEVRGSAADLPPFGQYVPECFADPDDPLCLSVCFGIHCRLRLLRS